MIYICSNIFCFNVYIEHTDKVWLLNQGTPCISIGVHVYKRVRVGTWTIMSTRDFASNGEFRPPASRKSSRANNDTDSTSLNISVYAYPCIHTCVRVCACMRACVRARVCVCVRVAADPSVSRESSAFRRVRLFASQDTASAKANWDSPVRTGDTT